MLDCFLSCRDAQLLNNMYMCTARALPVGERSFRAPLTPGVSYGVRWLSRLYPHVAFLGSSAMRRARVQCSNVQTRELEIFMNLVKDTVDFKKFVDSLHE